MPTTTELTALTAVRSREPFRSPITRLFPTDEAAALYAATIPADHEPETIPAVRFVCETLVTDTRVYEVIGATASTLRLRSTGQGEVVKRRNVDGNPYPLIWHEATVDEAGRVYTVRLRKDGTYRMGNGYRPLRPAEMVEGVPATFTDYRE